MLREGEGSGSRGSGAARQNSCPLSALAVLAQRRLCGVGTAETLGPCREPAVPDGLAV